MLSWAGLDLPQDLRFSIEQLDEDQGPKSAVKLSFTSHLQCDAWYEVCAYYSAMRLHLRGQSFIPHTEYTSALVGLLHYDFGRTAGDPGSHPRLMHT